MRRRGRWPVRGRRSARPSAAAGRPRRSRATGGGPRGRRAGAQAPRGTRRPRTPASTSARCRHGRAGSRPGTRRCAAVDRDPFAVGDRRHGRARGRRVPAPLAGHGVDPDELSVAVDDEQHPADPLDAELVRGRRAVRRGRAASAACRSRGRARSARCSRHARSRRARARPGPPARPRAPPTRCPAGCARRGHARREQQKDGSDDPPAPRSQPRRFACRAASSPPAATHSAPSSRAGRPSPRKGRTMPTAAIASGMPTRRIGGICPPGACRRRQRSLSSELIAGPPAGVSTARSVRTWWRRRWRRVEAESWSAGSCSSRARRSRTRSRATRRPAALRVSVPAQAVRRAAGQFTTADRRAPRRRTERASGRAGSGSATGAGAATGGGGRQARTASSPPRSSTQESVRASSRSRIRPGTRSRCGARRPRRHGDRVRVLARGGHRQRRRTDERDDRIGGGGQRDRHDRPGLGAISVGGLRPKPSLISVGPSPDRGDSRAGQIGRRRRCRTASTPLGRGACAKAAGAPRPGQRPARRRRRP